MIQINTTINEDLDKRFRHVAVKKFGYKKGIIQKGLTEAMEMWIKENE